MEREFCTLKRVQECNSLPNLHSSREKEWVKARKLKNGFEAAYVK
jgi:hypothetical protein